MTERIPLVLAGARGREREVPVRKRDEVDWHVPPHVRDPARVRMEQADQVAAGADVVVAHTFRTSRRALVPHGESRRAAAWTAAAVELAREAVELGGERRERAADSEADSEDEVGQSDHELPADGSDPQPALLRPPVRVAGALASPLGAAGLPTGLRLDDGPDDEHLLAGLREHADRIADAGADLLLVGPVVSPAELRIAILAAAETGLETWAAVSDERPAGGPMGGRHDADAARWAEAVPPDLEVRLLLTSARADGLVRTRPSSGSRPSTRGVLLDLAPVGSHADPALLDGTWLRERAAAWLGEGAAVLGVVAGAAPGPIQLLRAAVDELLRERQREEETRTERFRRAVADAARRAPGGEAVWVGGDPRLLPDGFAWTVLPADRVPLLPAGRYRLVVGGEAGSDLRSLGRLLDRGGWLLARSPSGVAAVTSAGVLRVVAIDADDEGDLVLARRDP